jgi:hypothetical protein
MYRKILFGLSQSNLPMARRPFPTENQCFCYSSTTVASRNIASSPLGLGLVRDRIWSVSRLDLVLGSQIDLSIKREMCQARNNQSSCCSPRGHCSTATVSAQSKGPRWLATRSSFLYSTPALTSVLTLCFFRPHTKIFGTGQMAGIMSMIKGVWVTFKKYSVPR